MNTTVKKLTKKCQGQVSCLKLRYSRAQMTSFNNIQAWLQDPNPLGFHCHSDMLVSDGRISFDKSRIVWILKSAIFGIIAFTLLVFTQKRNYFFVSNSIDNIHLLWFRQMLLFHRRRARSFLSVSMIIVIPARSK